MAPDLANAFNPALLQGHGPALVGGILLLGFGAKLYRAAVLLPGILAGVYAGAWLHGALSLGTTGGLLAIGGFALVGAVICHVVESVALPFAGAVLFAGAAWWAWPLFVGAPPFWVPLAGAALGGLAFRYVFERVLKPATAVAGAFTVAWATGQLSHPAVVAGLAVVGTVVQFALAGGGDTAPPAPKAGKKKK